jgi:hypothetical protein
MGMGINTFRSSHVLFFSVQEVRVFEAPMIVKAPDIKVGLFYQ